MSKRAHRIGLLLAPAVVLAACLVTTPALPATALAHAQPGSPQPDDPRTILDRVFSVAQADRGEQRFRQSCSGCHTVSQFAEPLFSARWEGQTLGDLYAFISAEMPQNDPGGLMPDQYADVIGFFLGISGYPVGNDDLPADKAVLSTIGIVPQPK